MSRRRAKTTSYQRGGITGAGFVPGQSGNPAGRPRSERALLTERYGEDARGLFDGLDHLLRSKRTPARLKFDISRFLIERLHGRTIALHRSGGMTLEELLEASRQPHEYDDTRPSRPSREENS